MTPAGPPPEPPDTIDLAEDGMAGERTDLAWGRSGLALMACGAVIGKGLPTISRSPAEPILGLVILALGGGVWLLGWSSSRRHRRRIAVHPARGGPDRPLPRVADLRAIALGTTAVGIAGILLAIRGPG